MSLSEFLKSTPWLLKITALAAFALAIALPLIAAVPGATFDISGTLLSHEQIWASGVAFAIFALAPLMLTVGLGIFYHRRWVRWLLIALPILQFLPFQLAHWYFSGPNPTPDLGQYILLCSAWFAAAFAYLFAWPPAQKYFGRTRT